jgi:hypothetical protein
VLGKAAKRLRDVVRDRRLLGDDEGFGHILYLVFNTWEGVQHAHHTWIAPQSALLRRE